MSLRARSCLTLSSLPAFGTFFSALALSPSPALITPTVTPCVLPAQSSQPLFLTPAHTPALKTSAILSSHLPPSRSWNLIASAARLSNKHLCLRFCLTGIRLYSVSWTSPHFLITPPLYKDPSLLFLSLPCPTDTSTPPKSVTFVLWFWFSIFLFSLFLIYADDPCHSSSCCVHLTFSLPLLPWSFSFTH